MFDTVYKMMQDSERELNSKQILQILSSSGIVLNTFFHEFNAINTQFHVRASQIRSRVRHILKGQEYTGIAAYNPYPWIDALEKTDRVTAAFLDVVMELLTGHRPMQVRAIFNQIIVDHISVIRILTAHLLVHLTLTMLIGALKDRGE